MARTPEDQARVDSRIREVETHFGDTFTAMGADQLVDLGVSIFRCASDGGIPTVNAAADRAVRAVLNAIVKAEAPEPLLMEGRTAAAWRMFTGELIRRAAVHHDVDFREVPLDEQI